MLRAAGEFWSAAEVIELHDVVLGPLAEGSSKRRFIIESNAPDSPITHFHTRAGNNVIALRPLPDGCTIASRHEGAVIFGGPLLLHFSHFLADAIHRLWARVLVPELADAPVVYIAQPRKRIVLPDWAVGVLSVLGLRASDLILLQSPTSFSRLLVPQQARIMSGPTLMPGYSNLFPFAPSAVPEVHDGPKRIYLSRSRHGHTGCFLGESYVERILETRAGFTVVHPEDLAVPQLVGLLRQAEMIVIAEGGAVHVLEITGPLKSKVAVIARRTDCSLRFRNIVSGVTPDFAIIGDVRAGVLFDPIGRKKATINAKAANIIDLASVSTALGAFLGLDLGDPDQAEIRTDMRLSLMNLLLDQRLVAADNAPQLFNTIMPHLRKLAREGQL